MKFKTLFFFALAFCILFFGTGSFGVENKTPETPSVYFPEKRYIFSPILDGTDVIHDYILYNKGTDPLQIEKVKTGWGCTAVSYTRQIPPGGEGKITIKVDTSGYGGRTITKRITVKTNDPKQPIHYLIVAGNIERFVTLVPKRVSLRGYEGKQMVSTVKIIPEEKYPFKIVGSEALFGNNIRFKIEATKTSKRTEYVLTVENLKKDKGRYYDTISLKTDSKIRPLIKVRVNGYILAKDRKKNN